LRGKNAVANVGQTLRAVCCETKSGIGRNGDMPADRFCIDHLNARQLPRGLSQGSVAFQPQLHDLPPCGGLSINNAQFRIGLIGWLANEIIAQPRHLQASDGIALRNSQQDLAHRRFANIQLELAINRGFRFARGDRPATLKRSLRGAHCPPARARRSQG
jgi:hypothetical protein